ncbi:Pseudouridylate synthase [Klebsormidium nitens]|uniref:Pseudouridylate synthase n=1 Tax=Klebsormidium nitens TaxID=105231 RepID=A0A1Y1I0P1_KLENI|nr:Pseudouridylate synthase [Klebsormidium nitens]|eukprot:GAQ83532.1 Pseudouridylate synthase [Klebsormidium nitens]
MRSTATSLRSQFLSSSKSTIIQGPTFLMGNQNWGRSLAFHSRVSATADVVKETREAPAPEELEREERRPLPRSLPVRPSKDVWVRPGVTPPPGTSASDEPPRKSFARPPRAYPQKVGVSRQPWEGHFARTEENRLRADKVRTAGVEGDKQAAEDDKPAKAVVKKKVAMWLGYVGTDFKGSMMQRNQPGATVEAALEKAIFDAGGMKESNFGDFKKIGWNRSSRTDKGVHALASVVSFKMEVPAEVFAHDPDGLSLADRVNAHLPPSIRVYGVQPVTKSFNSYHNCRARTYEYVLPASIIGITDDMDEVAAHDTLEQLRAILRKYEGRQPFHNFTVRRLYRSGKKGSKRKVTRLTQETETLLDLEGNSDDFLPTPPSESANDGTVGLEMAADLGTSDSDMGDRHSDVGDNSLDVGDNDSDVGSSTLEALRGRSDDGADTDGNQSDAAGRHPDTVENDSDASGRSDEFQPSDEFGRAEDAYGQPSPADEFFANRRESEEFELEYDEEEEDDEGSWVERRGPTAQWLLETPPEDKIGPSHYRRILNATCTDLEPLGRSRVVRIHIEGESFMLHQIRKMVGAAVAILRGDFPFELLDPMLACHSRVIVPMAPAEGLFLSRTRFFPFRTSFNRDFVSDGPALELTPPLEAAREEFRVTQLLPAMAPLLNAERDPWRGWIERLDLIGPVPQEEVTQVLSCFEEWRSNQPERGTETRERPPWFQIARQPRPTGPRQWASRGGMQTGGGGSRWGRR